ncbi:hypothetical protein AVEN_142479-1 [Araneus ventricosus]|uniref:Uncharacterized protein n=1 Tax=Araneus ventricosus TaxID=182803 RepID=A0A4Y2DTS2_ARAVE|nr:hypothetical protein AVEN_142479-1 [Araneus ventricosus]
MLLAMLTDKRCRIRTLAARRIIKTREIGPDSNYVRRFVIPAVNFRATDYVHLIDWQAFNVTPPTVLRHISSHELICRTLLNFLHTRKQLSELNSSLKPPEKDLDRSELF